MYTYMNTSGVNIYVYIYTYIHVRRIYICIYIYIYTHKYMSMHTTDTHIHIYRYTHTYSYMYIYTYVYIYMCIYLYIYTYDQDRCHKFVQGRNQFFYFFNFLCDLIHAYVVRDSFVWTQQAAAPLGQMPKRLLWTAMAGTPSVTNADSLKVQRIATHCNTLQHTATHAVFTVWTRSRCQTLHHTSIHCNALQYTATHSKTPSVPYVDAKIVGEEGVRARECVWEGEWVRNLVRVWGRENRCVCVRVGVARVGRRVLIHRQHSLQHTATAATHCNIRETSGVHTQATPAMYL